ncbi:MAG: LptF/LptG family permease [Bacteroidia bacterium]
MFSILDKYILKKFMTTFIYAIALILVITVVFDISEKLDDFIDNKAPIKEIVFDYYVNFLPYFCNMFSPLFVFIAVIFFTSKMASNTEIVAILNSRVSFWRMLVPYMVGATAICVASLFLSNFIIPHANKTRLQFEDKYIWNKFHFTETNVHRKLDKDNFVYFENYDNTTQTGYKFSLEKFKGNRLVYKLNADVIRWDSLKQLWIVENVNERKINNLAEVFTRNPTKELKINLNPDEFSKRVTSIETYNYFELNKYIKDERARGNENVVFFEEEKHKRIAMPFATFALTLIGVSVASRKVRGGIGLHIALGLALSFSYIMVMQIATKFALYSNFNIVLASWLPNIIYLLLSFILLRLAPK